MYQPNRQKIMARETSCEGVIFSQISSRTQSKLGVGEGGRKRIYFNPSPLWWGHVSHFVVV